ncbi:MAG TPA: amino acid ABC transporter substrate-binding protein [Thermodesulfobacteriota bacterium]|nr:amino acid ABC transporter substrate-binding protein [Thermodesulfobacteriota bacterium]
MGRRRIFFFLALFVLAVGPCATAAFAQDSIKIGAVLPLSKAAFAQAGEEQRRGLLMALEEINQGGGVLGKKIDLIIEDDTGEPSVGIAACEKLLTRDKVVALIGGYSSTITYAQLNAIQRLEPFVAWVGASSTKVEHEFGPKRWFFHYHPWDYHRQSTIRDFLLTLSPKPKTVAVGYEDGIYGTTSRDYAVKYLKEKGFDIVFDERFKSGASDFTPMLTKIKKANPDVFYWVAYAGDTTLLMKQAKEIDFNPKLFLSVAVNFPQYKSSLGSTGDFVSGVDVWIPGMKLPETVKWMEKFNKAYPGRVPEYWAPLAYTNLMTVADAIKRAGSTDKEKMIAAMEKTDYNSPMGRMTFKKSEEGGLHQAIDEQIITQWQSGVSHVVYPASKATGKLIYPTPEWKKR